MNQKFFRYGKPKISCVCDDVWLKRYVHLRVKLCEDGVQRWVKIGEEFPHKYPIMQRKITDLDMMRIKIEMISGGYVADFNVNESDGENEIARSLPPGVLIVVAVLLWVVVSYYIK